MIRLRDDDVLLPSSRWPNPLRRFQSIHRSCCFSDRILHVPTILTEDLERYPEAVAMIREETAAGRMEPQLHGLYHLNYAALGYTEVVDHLSRASDWMLDNLGSKPTIWYTPWGANAPMLYDASRAADLRLVDCSKILRISDVCRALSIGAEVDALEGREIFFHWWETGMRVKRLCFAVKYGSWEAAAQAEPEVFGCR